MTDDPTALPALTEEQRAKLLAWTERHPVFLGHALRWWKETHAASDAALAEYLFMREQDLVWLAICHLWDGGQGGQHDWSQYLLGLEYYGRCNGNALVRLINAYYEANYRALLHADEVQP